MTIRTLRIENLGPHEETVLSLAPVNVLVGPNGAGKSWILDALQVMRSGTARGIQQIENHQLIRDGAKGWAVELEILGPKGELSSLRRTRTVSPTVGALDAVLGDARRFHALFEVTRFLSMKRDDRKVLAAACFGADSGEVLRQLMEIAPFPDDSPLVVAVKAGNLRRAFAIAEDGRLQVQRDLKALDASAAAGVLDVEVVTKKGTVKVSTLPAETVRVAAAKAAESLAKGLQVEEQLKALKALEAEATAATNALAALQEKAGWTKEEEESLRTFLRQADGAAQMATAAAGRRNDRKQEELRLREILKQEGACPTCGGSLTKDRKAMLEAEVARLEREAKEAHADYLRETESAKKTRESAAELERRSSGVRSVASQIKALEATITRWQIATEKGVPEKPNLEALRADHERLRKIHEARVAYDASLRAAEGSKEQVEAVRQRLETFERVSAAVRPDGVGDEEGVLAFLNAQVQEYARDLFPGRLPPSIGKDWEVTILGRPAALASDSERLRAGLCFAIALSVGAGPGIVLLDRGESLNPGNLNAVITLLARLAERGEIRTALLTRVQANANRPQTLPQGVKWFHIDEGKAKEV